MSEQFKPRPFDVELLAHIGAVRRLCEKGVLACPPDHQGGYNVAWMRRQLLGKADHRRVSDKRLRYLMSRKGIKQTDPMSTVYRLAK